MFAFFFLAIFPVMMIQDMDIIGSIRWPFYLLATTMFMYVSTRKGRRREREKRD